eukprot:6031683-Karenia_brevis.AAC.1
MMTMTMTMMMMMGKNALQSSLVSDWEELWGRVQATDDGALASKEQQASNWLADHWADKGALA